MRTPKKPLSVKALIGFCGLVVLLTSSSALCTHIATGVNAEEAVEVVSSDALSARLNVRLSAVDIEKVAGWGGYERVQLSLPEEPFVGTTSEPGSPELPLVTKVLAIPDAGNVAVKILSADYREYAGHSIVPVQRPQPRGEPGEPTIPAVDEEVYSRDQFYPLKIAWVGPPGIMRDLRLVTLSVAPVQFNPKRGVLRVYSEIKLEVNFGGGSTVNLKHSPTTHVSRAFALIYKSLVANYEYLDLQQSGEGKYWIIAHDDFMDDINLSRFVEWKRMKGFEVVINSLSEIGTNPSYAQIYNFIYDTYHSWEVKPDYLLLVGDVYIGSGKEFPTQHYYNNYGDGASDNYYAFLQGFDYFPEVLIGRLPVDNVVELGAVVQKTLDYEMEPYMDQTHWYKHAIVSCGQDDWSGFVSPKFIKMWCRERLFEVGFTQVDTVFRYNYNRELGNLLQLIDNGVGFINYRGWGRPDGWTSPGFSSGHIFQLSNGRMAPIMTSIVCGTGDFTVDECFGEYWVITEGKGGPGFIGNTNHDAHTRWTNAIDCGLYWGLTRDSLETLAQIMLEGKMNLYRSFPNDQSSSGQVALYFNTYNVLGDPDLSLWIDIPREMVVFHEESIPFGVNTFPMTVYDQSAGPLSGAMVTLYKPGELFERQLTGESGKVEMYMPCSTPGSVKLTVTKQGFIPYIADIEVESQSKVVGHLSHEIDDDNSGGSQGDDDGKINPGETIELPVTLKNYGTSEVATGVTAQLSCPLDFITVLDDLVSFGDIAPGGSAPGQSSFRFSVAQDATYTALVPLKLSISATNGGSWESTIREVISAPYLEVVDFIVDDEGQYNPDGVADPGEEVDLILEVQNSGDKPASNTDITLSSDDEAVQIIISLAPFGDIAPGGTARNDSYPFRVRIAPETFPGHQINLELAVTSEEGDHSQNFGLVVGTVSSDDPVGPDNYGYYIFDDTDYYYADAPTYNWIEIDTFTWDHLPIPDDEARTVALPFPFKYYGEEYTQLTICDNGFVAMGETWWANFLNSHIPGPQNAPAMIAPFWDDFKGSGYYAKPTDVYYHHDLFLHAFIVGWPYARDDDNGQYQTFEIVFNDPGYYPTNTGDGEIIFQYKTVRSPSSVSVGMCNQAQHDGLQYLFDNHYHPGAASLGNERALKITTGTWDVTGVKHKGEMPTCFSLRQNYPNPFNPVTTIYYELAHQRPQATMLAIYNLRGQTVRVLLEKAQPAGRYQIAWDGKDQRGNEVASGVYFYRLTSGDYREARRMVLVR
jgi:hypothetical protein